ncbi:hypothetical protein CSUI_003125, partial [Cystoisospora suis]
GGGDCLDDSRLSNHILLLHLAFVHQCVHLVKFFFRSHLCWPTVSPRLQAPGQLPPLSQDVRAVCSRLGEVLFRCKRHRGKRDFSKIVCYKLWYCRCSIRGCTHCEKVCVDIGGRLSSEGASTRFLTPVVSMREFLWVFLFLPQWQIHKYPSSPLFGFSSQLRFLNRLQKTRVYGLLDNLVDFPSPTHQGNDRLSSKLSSPPLFRRAHISPICRPRTICLQGLHREGKSSFSYTPIVVHSAGST